MHHMIFCVFLIFQLIQFLLFHRQLGNTDSREETTLLRMETSYFLNLMHQMHQRRSEPVCLHWLSFLADPHCHIFFSFPSYRPEPPPPTHVPKHRFSKLWQLCYLRSGSAPTPNCSSIWRSILLSRYFINLHHGCQHWHSWQRGQCHLLLSPFCR